MRKHILRILVILLIAFAVNFVVNFVIPLAIFSYNHFWKYSADYENYAYDFNLVKNYVAEKYSGESDKRLDVSRDFYSGVIRLYDPETESYLALPGDVAASLTSIDKNAFPDKDSNLYSIRIQDNRISFCIFNGEYALVYSPNQKPSWVNSPNENSKAKAKKIQDGWYHVVKDKR